MLTNALVVHKPGAEFKYEEINVHDDLRDNEVLVKMKATGVCHTDLNFRNEQTLPGLHPAVFGHEGDHVVLTYTSCGDCKYCNNHETSFCNDWERDNFGSGRTDGTNSYSAKGGAFITSHFFGQSSFAKYAVVMERSLVKVDIDLPLDALAPLGCGIMTGAGAMLNVVRPTSDSIVVVVGAGAVGLAALMALRLASSPPKQAIAVDRVPERLKLAMNYGATDAINSRETPDLRAALNDITDGKGVDGAIDTTGNPEVLRCLLESSAKKGVVVSVGVGKLSAEVSTIIFDTVNTGRSYIGCCMGNCYPQEFIPILIDAWRVGKFPFTELVRQYPAKEMNIAAQDVLEGSVVKAVLVWE